MVARRPEIVNFDVSEQDERHAIHHAVLTRQPDMVRLLMHLGADPRTGIYPHRQATTAIALAIERGYDEIAAIMRDEEPRRPEAGPDGTSAVSAPSEETGLISSAIAANREDTLRQLLESGRDPDESGTLPGVDEVVPTWGQPLRECAIAGRLALARLLLEHGANANTNVYAASSALYEAYTRRDTAMIALIEGHGGRLDPIAIANLALVEPARRLLEETPELAPDVLWGAMGNASAEIVSLALERIDWRRDDRRWYRHLENGMYTPVRVENFRLVLARSPPDVSGHWNATLLHQIAAARGRMTADERLALATLVLDAGARLDLRDTVLLSTPLGWASRWGRVELVRLFLDRGADPIEADAESWATPRAWAEKMGRRDVLALLSSRA